MQNFLAAYRKSQASSNSDAFLCCRAKEFHAQARQENGAGIVLTAALDRKFRPFSPQRADEIPRAAAGTQRCSLLIALCTCPPETGPAGSAQEALHFEEDRQNDRAALGRFVNETAQRISDLRLHRVPVRNIFILTALQRLNRHLTRLIH